MPLISSRTASKELPGIFLNIRTGRTTQSCPEIHKVLHGHCHCGQVHQGPSQPERGFNEAETMSAAAAAAAAAQGRCGREFSTPATSQLVRVTFCRRGAHPLLCLLQGRVTRGGHITPTSPHSPRKAAEPGGIVKWVLKEYADQLAATSGFSTRLFASPLSHHA